MVLNLFPSGQEAQSPAPAEMPLLTLSPAPVLLTACKRTEDGADTLLRLFNPTGSRFPALSAARSLVYPRRSALVLSRCAPSVRGRQADRMPHG